MALLRLRTKITLGHSCRTGAQLALTAALLCAFPVAAWAFEAQHYAQAQLLPPQNIPRDQQYANPQGPIANQSDGGDASSLFLEVQRLEGEVRRLTGQVQELQFHQRQLEKKLAQQPASAAGASAAAVAGETQPGDSHGDAFNPADHPGAVGAPEPLGSTKGSRPIQSGNPQQSGEKPQFGRPLGLDTNKPPASSTTGQDAGALKATYASGLSLYHQGRYRDAVLALTGYINKNPKAKQTPDALYILGMSYTHRNLNRQAAEQYLRLSTDFPTSSRAPSGLVHLGIALNALGAKEDACAALNQVAQKYPKFTSAISQANVEARRDGC